MSRATLLVPVPIALILLQILLLGDLREHAYTYAFVAAAATIILYGGYLLIRRSGLTLGTPAIVGTALLLRLIVLPIQPSLSDDAWRYLWDGRLVTHGLSPYSGPPADSRFSHLHDDLYRVQGYPTTNTIYPPGVQLWFAGAVSFVSPGTEAGRMVSYYIWKVFLVAAELAAILLLIGTLRRLGRSIVPVILYAWHPLAVMEIAGQGHTDGLWVLALALACYWFVAGRAGRGLGGLAFGASVRLFPLLMMPVWYRYLDRRERIIGIVLSIPFMLLLALLLDPDIIRRFGEVAVRFTDYYEFNGGAYYAVKSVLDTLHIKPSNVVAGRITTGVLLLGVAVVTLWPIRSREFGSLLARLLVIVTLQIALTAKSHVWYGVAPLALVTLEARGRFRPLWLWLTLVAPLTYLYYASDPPGESLTLLWIEWGGAVVAWVVGEIWWRRPGRED